MWKGVGHDAEAGLRPKGQVASLWQTEGARVHDITPKVVACRPWDTVATGRPQNHHAKGAHGIMAKNDDPMPRGTTPVKGPAIVHLWEGAHGIGRGRRAWPQIGFRQAKKDRMLHNALHHATCVQPLLLHALAFQRRACVYMRAHARACVRIRAWACARYRC